ncbi:hypothetical protein [Paraliomyxa miuraensis]|uniref:hypothetical protein n=1 Tax=Paraliomyxa miuraensis TaxID=376150 RepID=UPI002252F948|nr:hypothetical protein [Paraliomyxa miuraensis]MCX4240879.1 hypothetical protein [Paraliomyxa miuraensis]
MDPVTPKPPAAPSWGPIQRLAFRFGALYFALYALPFPLDMVPGVAMLAQLYFEAWNAIIPWVGNHVLGIGYEIAVGPNGSGDTTADYVKLFMILVLAAVGSVAWGMLDRRQCHPRLAAWLTVWARYWLGTIMIGYGVVKVFALQFPEPDAFRLAEPYGESSPMGLVWAFMGYSHPYQAFTGGMEVLGGVLLLWRRTTTLGALVCVGVMSNVVMLNFCYDIPVKLFSSHLLAVAVVLASHDARRLWGVLLTGQAVPGRQVPPVLDGRRGRRIRVIVKGLLLGLVLLQHVVGTLVQLAQHGSGAPTPPLYGIYDVTAHELDGHPLPVLAADARTWRQVTFSRWGRLALWPVHGQSVRYTVTVNEEAGTLELIHRDDVRGLPRDDEPEPQILRFHTVDETTLVIEGSLDGVEHRATLQRIDEQRTRLLSRGFHWINEKPYNR